jgi:hypothetical protein
MITLYKSLSQAGLLTRSQSSSSEIRNDLIFSINTVFVDTNPSENTESDFTMPETNPSENIESDITMPETNPSENTESDTN